MEYISKNVVRGNAVAGFTVMLLALCFAVAGYSWLAGALLSLQVINFYLGGKGSKSLIYVLGESYAKLFNDAELEHKKAVRFANTVGFVLLSFSTVFYLLGSPIYLLFLVACLFASFLNGFLGFCIACWFYPKIMRLRHR